MSLPRASQHFVPTWARTGERADEGGPDGRHVLAISVRRFDGHPDCDGDYAWCPRGHEARTCDAAGLDAHQAGVCTTRSCSAESWCTAQVLGRAPELRGGGVHTPERPLTRADRDERSARRGRSVERRSPRRWCAGTASGRSGAIHARGGRRVCTRRRGASDGERIEPEASRCVNMTRDAVHVASASVPTLRAHVGTNRGASRRGRP